MIDSQPALRALYPEPGERALRKQIDALDGHCMRFIVPSPFVVLATGGDALDASPRGGAPGFVRQVDAHTLLIADAPGKAKRRCALVMPPTCSALRRPRG